MTGIDIPHLAHQAREASRIVSTLDTETRNGLLRTLSAALEDHEDEVLQANAADMQSAREAGLPSSKLRRLELTESSFAQLRAGLHDISLLPDPVGEVTRQYTAPSGLLVQKVRTPLGVICMIYEARPGVTIDAFALCFKAGNACILKGGKEAAASNQLLGRIVRDALVSRGLPPAAVTALTTSDRESLRELLSQDQYIDLVIPRGGAELIRFVAMHSRIPTVQHYHGICHIVVDAAADLDMALRICLTAKTSAPATCNAAECILIHRSVAEAFVPRLVDAYSQAGVAVRGDEAVCRLAAKTQPAHPDDFGREFLDLIVAMRVVPDLAHAIEHIHRYGSNHTESIITADPAAAAEFTRRVQSSCTLVNASTRMNDGYSLGLGAEIGISTSRVHAYGPMGLEELTAQRFVVTGSGQTR